MKKLLITLLILLLLPTIALATELGKDKYSYIAGVDIAPSTYQVSRTPDCTEILSFGIIDDRGILDTFLMFEDDTCPITFTLTEGQELHFLSGYAIFTPLTADTTATRNTKKPLQHVDLDIAFADAEKAASDTNIYPLLNSLTYSYNQDTNSIELMLSLLDEATDEEGKTYAYDFVRLLNTQCMYQDITLTPASRTSYGGIYDKLSCVIIACRQSDYPDESKFILYDYIPADTHGYSTLDVRKIQK